MNAQFTETQQQNECACSSRLSNLMRRNGGIFKISIVCFRFSGTKLIKGNGYEAKQVSLLYVFVNIFGLDRAQSTIDFQMC